MDNFHPLHNFFSSLSIIIIPIKYLNIFFELKLPSVKLINFQHLTG